MKKCSKCQIIKDEIEFHKDKTRKDGLDHKCKICKREQISKSDLKYREKRREYHKKYYCDNLEYCKNQATQWRINNREQTKKIQNNYSKNHRNVKRINAIKRRLSLIQSKCKWANQYEIDKIYKKAIDMEKETGKKYHVDHIIPLRHPLVCGLHHENNLQILESLDNLKKNNKFAPIIESEIMI